MHIQREREDHIQTAQLPKLIVKVKKGASETKRRGVLGEGTIYCIRLHVKVARWEGLRMTHGTWKQALHSKEHKG